MTLLLPLPATVPLPLPLPPAVLLTLSPPLLALPISAGTWASRSFLQFSCVQRSGLPVQSMRGKARKYKHISWRQTNHTAGWIVQWRGKTIGGFHADEEDAAETLRKARGLKRKSQLEVASASGPLRASQQRSAFMGVSFHKGFQRFVVHDVSTGGTYSTARADAKARAEALGLPAPARRIGSKELVKRISFMRKVYMPVRGQVRLFADLRSAAKHASSRESQAMFAAEPTLEMMCIQLKYDPWRNSLLSAWKKVGRRSVACRDVKSLRDDGLHERACHLHAVLVHVVRNMDKAHLAAWSSNCSRIVGRHSSPERVLQHLGILAEPASPSVQRSASTEQDIVCALKLGSDEVEASVQKLMKVIWGWTCICKKISRAPRTCQEWMQIQSSMMDELHNLKVHIPRLGTQEDSYVRAWTLRTLLFMRMRREGIKQLVADTYTTPFAFCRLCPDQNHHLTKLYYALRPTSIADFLHKCGFKGGPPELLSCFACFAGDMAWDELEESQYNVKSWTQALDKYQKKHGLTAIPPVIMREL